MKGHTSRGNPIRVYLDSSDIDNLSDSRKLARDSRLPEAVESLKELSANGVAEFRFSFFHIIELAHVEETSKPFALKRATLVKELCGSKALLNSDALWRFEALSLVQDNEPESARGAKARVYIDDFSWLPPSVVETSNQLVDSMIKDLKRRIGERTTETLDEIGSNRKTRRAMIKKILGKRGVTELGAQIAERTPDLFMDGWKRKLPLTKRFWEQDLPLRFLNHKISLEELRAECLAGFGDIDNFIGWCIDLPSISHLTKTIRSNEPAQHIEDLLEEGWHREQQAKELLHLLEPKAQVRHALKAVHGMLQDATAPDLALARVSNLGQLRQSNNDWFRRRGVGDQEWESRVARSALGALPSMDVFLRMAGAQFQKLAVLSKEARKYKPSDLADLLHCQYLPYVDFFRADDYTRSLINGFDNSYRTKLVPNTLALPDMIREEAKTRHLL
jgi:hypothetical protein